MSRIFVSHVRAGTCLGRCALCNLAVWRSSLDAANKLIIKLSQGKFYS